MKKLLLITSLVSSTSLMATPQIPDSERIGSFTVEEIREGHTKSVGPGIPRGFSNTNVNPNPNPLPNTLPGTIPSPFPSQNPNPTNPGQPYPPTFREKVENTGKVIQTLKDLVVLGESIYDLVKKGKPSNVTEYAPLSVVPRDPDTKEFIDPFDLENFALPTQRTFVAKVKNAAGKEVVSFTYKVVFAFGGSYNGKGKYLTGVTIVPVAVKTSFGWDFNASMKVASAMNHGTKENPVAGLLLTLKFQINSWSSALERNDTVHVTGNGELKSFVDNN